MFSRFSRHRVAFTPCTPCPGTPWVRRSSGFTLIELLVVIAIIAILASILFPVFAQARAKARSTACLSNMRQLGTAALMYAQDYDEYPVPTSMNLANEIPGYTWYRTTCYWPAILQPYVKNTEIFWCPNAPFAKPVWGPGVEWRCYGFNNHYSNRVGHTTPMTHTLAAISYPAEFGIMVDTPGVCLLWVHEFIRTPSPGGRNTWPSHNGGVNMAFADGHAKWVHASTYVGKPDIGNKMWGVRTRP